MVVGPSGAARMPILTDLVTPHENTFRSPPRWIAKRRIAQDFVCCVLATSTELENPHVNHRAVE